MLSKKLRRLCRAKGLMPEWQPLLRDLDRLQEATIEKDGRIVTTRTHVTGQVGNVFKAAGIALPHNFDEQLAGDHPQNVVVTRASARLTC
nr:hypothetical protein [Mesorhizobium alhagi]